jgi:acyl-coenzyme A synthetase/AMP-(fatty) acid ligase
MSTVYDTPERDATPWRTLLADDSPHRVVAWQDGRPIHAPEFLGDVAALAARLPTAAAAINLCSDRYAFLVGFAALATRGQINLLPPSRAPHAVDEALRAHPGSYCLGDVALDPAPPHYLQFDPRDPSRAMVLDREVQQAGIPVGTSRDATPAVDPGLTVAIGYTSGSTGVPHANPKRWDKLAINSGHNDSLLYRLAGGDYHVVATVPPQHMYGLEFSVLLPLFGHASVHASRPLFAGDIAAALQSLPAPRVLVTTPVHLRALVEARQPLPPLAAIVSATAPLPRELAEAAERQCRAPLQEVFGSTETCVIAHRRTAHEASFTLYDGVALHPQPDGTRVEAPQLVHPVALADIVELVDGSRFRLRGRNTDLLEIAGKRASLGDLTHKLLSVPGVRDGIVFQLDEADAMGVRRIAALAVAPGIDGRAILAALRSCVDPVFLPRPLKIVDALPRSETGKLPRAALLALLRSN